jgi:GntR family transcriptional regulator, transcriptional repressor for pyruvate dehydrogenase complex
MSGAIGIDEQLPSEHHLAQRFQTSRSTIREALRLLSSENLIITRPGAHGGSSVKRPDSEWVANALHNSMTLLVHAKDLSIEELFSARALIEVPGAGLAAANRTDEHLDTLASLMPERPTSMSAEQLFEQGVAFHETLLHATGNRLLPLLGSPAYQITARQFYSPNGPPLRARTIEHHTRIYEAVLAGDSAAATQAMAAHLEESTKIFIAAAEQRATTEDQRAAPRRAAVGD